MVFLGYGMALASGCFFYRLKLGSAASAEADPLEPGALYSGR